MSDHLSVSAIETFRTCPMRYYFRYVEGLIIPPSGALVQGKAVHVAAEANLREKVERGGRLPTDEVETIAAEAFDAALSEAVLADDEKPGRLKDETVRMARTHAEFVAPALHPAKVEEWIEVEVPGVPVPFVGIVDVVEADGTVRDLKTARRMPAPEVADRSLQLTAYAYALGRGLRVALDFVLTNGTPVFRPSLRFARDYAAFEETVRRVHQAIEADAFWPNENGWWCSEKFCGYWQVCRKTLRKRVR